MPGIASISIIGYKWKHGVELLIFSNTACSKAARASLHIISKQTCKHLELNACKNHVQNSSSMEDMVVLNMHQTLLCECLLYKKNITKKGLNHNDFCGPEAKDR
jgi:hypothetical protein